MILNRITQSRCARSLFKVILPKAKDEDKARKEFILNIFLTGSFLLFFAGFAINFIDGLRNRENSVSSGILFAFLLFLAAIYVLARRGFVVWASSLLISSLFIFASVMTYIWGVDVPAAIVLYALIIVFTGVMFRARYAFLAALGVCLSMFTIGFLQEFHYIAIDEHWRIEPWELGDTVSLTVMFIIVAVVAWLSNREIEWSLNRARNSEIALTEERNMLEVRVAERAQELRLAQMEKMNQAYRFVEFGRLASGFFHDLMNPLTALSLNIENKDIERAKKAAVHMQKLMDSMRRHMLDESAEESFCLRRAIDDLIQVMNAYAQARDVALVVQGRPSGAFHGDPIAFTQIMTNLISNAVDSYEKTSARQPKEVRVHISEKPEVMSISVQDFGIGIPKERLPDIFEPFFTTKSPGKGLGIGLPLARRIIEKRFEGTISVDSVPDKGSIFVVNLPIRGSRVPA